MWYTLSIMKKFIREVAVWIEANHSTGPPPVCRHTGIL
jgi:hypothetical protein